MTPEQLQTKLEELEALVKTGKDYAQAEINARELLNIFSTIEDNGEAETEAFSPSAVAERGRRAESRRSRGEVEAFTLSDVEARILLALSTSLEQRGMSQEALPIAEQALALAEQAENKTLQAKAWNILGSVCNNLSDYPHALEYFGKALAAHEELGEKSGAAIVTGNIGNVYKNLSDYPRALEYYGKALAAHEELGDKSGAARVTGNIGNVYWHLSDYPLALEYMGKALAAHEDLGDKSGAALVTGNIGIVYSDLSDYPRALEYYGKALAAHEELGNKIGAALVTGNIGNVYWHLSDYPRALEYYGKALAAHKDLGNKSGAAIVTGNIGIVYSNLSDYPRALEYFGKALAAHEDLGEKSGAARVTGNIGSLYAEDDFEGYDPEKAVEYLLKAVSVSEEIGYKHHLYTVYKSLADLYKKEKRWEEFAIHFEKFYELEKEVQSEEAKKQAEKQDQGRKAAEREKQLAIERTRAQEKEKILNNILPEEITTRLIKGENPIADHFDCVSILFMDIVDFTKLSTTITAQQLVHLLNNIFTAADGVMREFGIEKIKTIGDAYMAVAGAPTVQADHAARAAHAALKLLDVMQNLVVQFPEEYGDRSWIEQIPEIQVRIGVHCGPAAAGVVGENKFLYDLWGDAVNTASRMESHGEAGKIHCSEAFARELGMTNEELGMKEGDAQLVIRNSQFVISSRGEMEIKGKGMMKTYFLEKT